MTPTLDNDITIPDGYVYVFGYLVVNLTHYISVESFFTKRQMFVLKKKLIKQYKSSQILFYKKVNKP